MLIENLAKNPQSDEEKVESELARMNRINTEMMAGVNIKNEAVSHEDDGIRYWLHKDDFSKKAGEYIDKHRKMLVALGLTAVAIMGGAVALVSCSGQPQPQPLPEPSPTPLVPTPTVPEATPTLVPTLTPTMEPTASPTLEPDYTYNRQWIPDNILDPRQSPYTVAINKIHEYFHDVREGSAMENSLAMFDADLWTAHTHTTPAQAFNLPVGKHIDIPGKPIMQVAKDCFAGDPIEIAPKLTTQLCPDIYTMSGYALDDPTNEVIDPAAIRVEQTLKTEIFVNP